MPRVAIRVAIATAALAALHAPAPASAFDLTLRYRAGGSDGLGTLFAWRHGSIRCAAGFVQALQSRVYTNSNDVEFWCRPAGRHPIGRFRALPRPTDRTRTSIANVDGTLFDLPSGQAFDFVSRAWSRLPLPAAVTQVRTIARVDGRRVVTGTSRDCVGLSVWVDGAYRGTAEVGGNILSAVRATPREIVVNMGGGTWRGRLARAANPCSAIALSRLGTVKDEYVYGYYRVGDRLLFGGEDVGGHEPCAAFYSASGSRVRRLPVTLADGRRCGRGLVTEWYSYTRVRDGVLVGTFPEGTLFHYRPPGRRLTESRFVRPGPNDWTSRLGTHHRESQAVVSASGLVLVGMWPWGEVVTIDEATGARRSVRLLGGPAKSRRSPTPYFWEAFAIARRTPGMRERYRQTADPTESFGYPETPLEPWTWGQRVTSIAVFDGRVCAATGSTRGFAYDPRLHPYIPASLAARYGTTYCAPVAGQTLTREPVPARGTLRFRVTRRELIVLAGGEVVARRVHRLSRAALAALRRGGDLTLGQGPYGRLAGTVTALR